MIQSRSLAIAAVSGDKTIDRVDAVAVEEPLEIRLEFRGPRGPVAKSVSITMRTPGHDVDLALGFLYGEGIIDRPGDVLDASPCGPPAPGSGVPNVVKVRLRDESRVDLARLERHFYTTSSCGVCGKSSLEALSLTGSESLAADGFRVAGRVLDALPARLREHQLAFDETGGLHAAALFDSGGDLLLVREDVGRHNAVDKVVGQLLDSGTLPAAEHGLLVSGRASFELMQKALRAGIPMLAAVGAPSSLAVAVANEFGMTLVGFLRDSRFNIYAGRSRVAR